MFTNPRKTLRIINLFLYFGSITLLVGGLVLTTTVKPVEADSGSVKTRSSCGVSAVNTNHYAVGDHVYIYYTGMGSGTHTWEIRYTNKAGQPLVQVASNPSIKGTGTVLGDTGCFDAWVIQPEEANYRFSVAVDNKQDGYGVDLATAIPTITATDTDTPTPPATTPPATETPVPTDTPTPPATTPPATETPVSTETPSDPVTSTATEETVLPTPPDPTETEIATQDPTGQPTDALTTTTQATLQITVTAVPPFSIPASANANMLSPMTGADFSHLRTGSGTPRKLQMSGLALLGAAIVMTGYRRKYNL